MDQVRRTGFENDPYLAAFGMKVGQRYETTEARLMDPPAVHLVKMASKSGLTVEDSNPHMIHMDQYPASQVEEPMKFKELGSRNRGRPQLIMVIKQNEDEESYRHIKPMSDTVLGIPPNASCPRTFALQSPSTARTSASR
ncbi:hypothetical protein PRIC1_008864 [Phytophthora ramorum]